MMRVRDVNERVTVVLRLLPYTDVDSIKQSIVAAGGRPSTWIPTQCVLAAEMPLSALDNLARIDGVVSLEIDSKLGPV